MNVIVLVFIGGAVGAVMREVLMLGTPRISDGFPLDIFVANIVAAFLLGITSALHARRVVTDDVNTLISTGVMGGLSTFSSFVYGAVVLMGASTQGMVVAIIYLVVSLVVSYAAVRLGSWVGDDKRKPSAT